MNYAKLLLIWQNRLCTEEIDPDCLVEYVACRLIPLDKGTTKDGKPGVRPIGVGEVLRRLVGKLLIGVVKDDCSWSTSNLYRFESWN